VRRERLLFAGIAIFLVLPRSFVPTLLETAGASIEPFVYVLLLWYPRRRPFVFGLLLAPGSMQREFTFLALPALVLAPLADVRHRLQAPDAETDEPEPLRRQEG
jgi:hypothetical protein